MSLLRDLLQFATPVLAALALLIAVISLRASARAERHRARAEPQPFRTSQPPTGGPAAWELDDRLRRVERRVETLWAGQAAAEPPAPAAGLPPEDGHPAQDAPAEVLWPVPAEPSYLPPSQSLPSGEPVEFDGDVLRASRSLSALGLLQQASEAGSPSLLYLNPAVELDHITLVRWQPLFEFVGGRSYARYRTTVPAEISWDVGTHQGRVLRRGAAEVV